MEVVLALVLVAVVLAFAFWRSISKRRELQAELGIEPEKRMSRRDKKLAEIRQNDPDPVIPTIEELVELELSETGVKEISGGVDLPDPVKLKVYHRDIAGLGDCPREALHFRLSYGIEAETATVDDVRLVCDADAAAAQSDGAQDGRADTEDGEDPTEPNG